MIIMTSVCSAFGSSEFGPVLGARLFLVACQLFVVESFEGVCSWL